MPRALRSKLIRAPARPRPKPPARSPSRPRTPRRTGPEPVRSRSSPDPARCWPRGLVLAVARSRAALRQWWRILRSRPTFRRRRRWRRLKGGIHKPRGFVARLDRVPLDGLLFVGDLFHFGLIISIGIQGRRHVAA